MRKSVGNTQAAPIVIESKGGSGGVLVPILGVGAVAVIGYFGYKAWDKKREEKAIDEANANALKSELSIKKRNEAINKIETGKKSFVSGKNSYGKQITVNLITQVKEAIDGFFIKTIDQYGTAKYTARSKENINQAKIKNAFFSMPVKNVYDFQKIFNIYTSKSFIEESQKLEPSLYSHIKVIFDVANKKFPVKGLNGRNNELTPTVINLL